MPIILRMNLPPILTGVVCLLAAIGPVSAADGREFDPRAILEHIEREDLSKEQVAELIDIGERIKERAKKDLTVLQRAERALINPWVLFGFGAQITFMMRFIIQIIASERKKRSYVPVAFWYLSLIGGSMLFVYALRLRDPVFLFGQGLGCFIYARNLSLIYRRRNHLNDKLAERQERNDAVAVAQGDKATP